MTQDMNAMFAEDAKKPTDEGLKEIVSLAQQQLSFEEAISQVENDLKNLTDRWRDLSEKIIPEKMAEMGLTEFKLESGSKITIKRHYFGSISGVNADKAFDWLKETGHDDIIKNKVTCDFGRGEEDKANELVEILKEHDVQFEAKKSVHPMTLKAFVKEQMTSGAEGFPLDLFGAHALDKSAIVRHK